MNGHQNHANRRVLTIVRHPVGGIRTHILYTYPLLMQAGYRFTFVIPEYEYHAPFCADVAGWPGVEIVQVGHRGPNHQKPRLFSTVRKLIRQRRFSLVHSHGIQAAIPTVFANLGSGVPHVMTSHDVFFQLGTLGRLDRLKLRVLERVLRRLDAVIAVSEDTRSDHLHYLPGLRRGRCRVEVIPNGIELRGRTPRRGRTSGGIRRQLSIGDETFLLGFLGRFMPQKGFLCLIEALDRLFALGDLPAKVHLLAVGSGDMLVNYRRDLDSRPNLSGRVTFIEQVQDVQPVLADIDLLVMPSLWEACPLLPMEAMCAGVPVLGTNCIGMREVLRDTPSMVVAPGDADSLLSGLVQAIHAPWSEAAKQFAPRARERFDVVPAAGKLQGIFNELMQ
jgi:glycosyltransferase involved in cell wall biosynthesis